MDTGRLTVRYKANPTGGRHIESQPTDAIDATTTAATHVHHQSGTSALGLVLKNVRSATLTRDDWALGTKLSSQRIMIS